MNRSRLVFCSVVVVVLVTLVGADWCPDACEPPYVCQVSRCVCVPSSSCNCAGRCGASAGWNGCSACDCPGECPNSADGATCDGGYCLCSGAPCGGCQPTGCDCSGGQCGSGVGWNGCAACDCGCPLGQVCDDGGTSQCGCANVTSCATLAQSCGAVWDGCRVEVCGAAECAGAVCGNGVVDAAAGSEECDDGNVLSGDGCSDACRLEAFSASDDAQDVLVPQAAAFLAANLHQFLTKPLPQPEPAFSLSYLRTRASVDGHEIALNGSWSVREVREQIGNDTTYSRVFSNVLANGAALVLTYSTMPAANRTLSVPGGSESRLLVASGIKLDVSYDNWPQADGAVTVELQLSCTDGSPVTVPSSGPTSTSPGGGVALWPLTADRIRGELGAFRYVTADDLLQPIVSLSIERANGVFSATFPAFNQSLRYDPDFGVLGGGGNAERRSRSDDASSSQPKSSLGAILGATLGGGLLLLCCCLLLAVFVVLVVLWRVSGGSVRHLVLRRDAKQQRRLSEAPEREIAE